MHLTSKLYVDSDDFNKEGKQAIGAALRMQFTKEFDPNHIIADMIKNIPAKLLKMQLPKTGSGKI